LGVVAIGQDEAAAMGRAAGEGSDLVVLTSDNPRSEEPMTIIEEALVGVKETGTTCIVEEDRRGAIEIAIRAARAGDIVLIAGKGHEKVQILRDGTVPFDDVAVAVIARYTLALRWAASGPTKTNTAAGSPSRSPPRKPSPKFGLVPQSAADAIRDKGNFTVDRINEIEAEVRHDVIAFTTTVAEHIDSPKTPAGSTTASPPPTSSTPRSPSNSKKPPPSSAPASSRCPKS
jgi:hypothetical protein